MGGLGPLGVVRAFPSWFPSILIALIVLDPAGRAGWFSRCIFRLPWASVNVSDVSQRPAGLSAWVGSPPALFPHSAGARPGDTPLPSPGCRPRCRCSAPGWSAGSGWFQLGPGSSGWFVFRPGLVRTPAWPGPSPAGMLLFRSQSRVREFCLPPGGFGRLGGLWGRQVCTGARRGCFAGGPSPADGAVPVPPGYLPGPARDIPGSLSEPRTGVLPPSRRGFHVLGRSGAVRPAQGGGECVSPGVSPVDVRAPVPPGMPSWAPAGMALFLPGLAQAACSRPGGGSGTSGPRGGWRPGPPPGRFCAFFCPLYIKGKKFCSLYINARAWRERERERERDVVLYIGGFIFCGVPGAPVGRGGG